MIDCNTSVDCNAVRGKYREIKNYVDDKYSDFLSKTGEAETELKNMENDVPMETSTFLGEKVKAEIILLEDDLAKIKSKLEMEQSSTDGYINGQIFIHNSHQFDGEGNRIR